MVLAPIFFVCLSIAATAETARQSVVDQSFEAVQSAVRGNGLMEIIQIDHARLAAAEGVEMPPSRVQLFSAPSVNAAIMKEEIRAGLDLPFRALSFDDMGKPALSYTSSVFWQSDMA